MPPDLLGQMSSAARDDVLRDPRWEGFARGDLSEPEEADLLAKARAAGIDEETIEALGPRDRSFDDRLAEAALAALSSGRASPRAGQAPELAALTAPAKVSASAPPAKVISIWARKPWIGGAAATLAAAAAALLWLLRPSDLPVFSMTVEGGTQGTRSTPADNGEVVRVAAGNRLTITVRPEVAARRQLDARAFVYGPSSSFAWPGAIAVADTGAVRLLAAASDVFGDAPPGRFKLCVSIGSAGSVPDSPGDAPLPPRGPDFVTVCRDLEWTGTGK